ncbi:MAG: ATP-dependent Clp protease proteolytic subunit [Phaeodactylibacter sp.]|nr:ATP-dependent Clp protease proteolytic subunit [Phaeodactylibacter sp.]
MTILNSTASVVPMVIDASDRAERAYDIYSLLLKERIVFLGTGVNDQVANLIVAQLLYLDSQNSTQPINMYINSPGGSVYAGMAIYDAMQMVKAPVYTTAVGVTASMGTVLLSSGEKGHRYALPHATIHMHPAGGGRPGLYRRCTYRVPRAGAYGEAALSHCWQEQRPFLERDRGGIPQRPVHECPGGPVLRPGRPNPGGYRGRGIPSAPGTAGAPAGG